jgi:hypothetical protein
VDAIRAASGVRQVSWANTREAGAQWGSDSTPCVTLRLRSPRSLGQDGERLTYTPDPSDPDDPAKGTLETAIYGNRVFTVTVRIETPDQRPGNESVGALASRLRTRLGRDSVIDALYEAGIAIVDILPTVDADYPADGGWVSASITDVILSACEWDVDDTASPDWIAQVQVQSDQLTEGGVPTSRQVDVEAP